ncbi:hypothetical protein K7X08_003645 [Anisodus acutangulus]|uniref:Uncharacterized protein n=1 Tax=Anisodus acutangulus TaxID=402998 RepID=A0A9Q1RIZ0_9SOLA|nr:hypothetical protein K7X08_003645 [Anisodus acutangulus]
MPIAMGSPNDEELMDLLFSFLEPDRPHCALLAGYFSKVVVCLMLRKTIPLMNYVQTHHDVLRQMVDLIGITSIMEKNMEWSDWHTTVLHERNTLENVYRWACGRPTALDRTRDSDEEDAHHRDYDVAALANNLSQAFQYTIYENNGAEEDQGALDRDDEQFVCNFGLVCIPR